MGWLSEADLCALKSFDQKNCAIRDYTRMVAHRGSSGLYICGPPGTSKTYTVETVLQEEDASFVVVRSHLTPVGLFRTIADNPYSVIVLDDVNAVFKNAISRQILLAALGDSPNGERRVEYHTAYCSQRCLFLGGIIALSNLMLGNDPISLALSSRCVALEYSPTQPEIKAFMKHIAMKGGFGLTPEELMEVVSFLIAASEEIGKPLDLRNIKKAAACYSAHRGTTESDWRSLVRVDLTNKAKVNGEVRPIRRDERKAKEQCFVIELVERGRSEGWTMYQCVQVWMEKTAKSERAFYRRKQEVEEAGRLAPDPLDDLPELSLTD
jgi:hypothetical protein